MGNSFTKAILKVFKKIGILPFVIIVMAIFIQSQNANFFSRQNMVNVARQGSILAAVAFGMTFVIICGCIDFSVGSVMGLSSVVGCTVMIQTGSVWIGIVVSIVIGLMCGLITGSLVAFTGIHTFIITLGTLSIYSGLAFIYTGGANIYGMPQSFLKINTGSIAGIIPYMICIIVFCYIILQFILNKTKFGYYMYEIGGNEEASIAAGINVKRYKIGAYAISGVMAALSGLLITTRVVSGQASVGQNYQLMAIGTAIIGGASLKGGKGTLGGTALGVVIVTILANGLNLLKVDSLWQQVATGVTIVIAVLIDAHNQRSVLKKKGGGKS